MMSLLEKTTSIVISFFSHRMPTSSIQSEFDKTGHSIPLNIGLDRNTIVCRLLAEPASAVPSHCTVPVDLRNLV
jgi:hypothetical protein